MKDYIYFKMDLQLFGEKTEPATYKKREEMRKKGQIPRSKELVTAFVLLITFWSIKLLSGYIFNGLVVSVRTFLSFPKDIDSRFNNEDMMQIFLQCLFIVGRVLLPILLIIAFVVIIVNYLQVGAVFTAKPLMPSLNKLNPIEGFKRLFSKGGFVEFLKSILKIGIIGYVVYDYLVNSYSIVPELLNMNVESSTIFIGNTIINIGIRENNFLRY
jgi:flagellar biosynthetic protein FlhB